MMERASFGIACCRFVGERAEVLMVCKRFTYAYNSFVHGKYKSDDDAAIRAYLGKMTVEEKIDLLSLNFAQIWYRIWLADQQRCAKYFVAKNKFESTFVVDGGARLRRLINGSRNVERLWEMPKGKKRNKSEPNINCAIREFGEETGLDKQHYVIYAEASRAYSYVDEGTRYNNTYYFALLRHTAPQTPRVNFASREQLNEIASIRWMTLDDLRRVDTTGRTAAFVRPILRYMRKQRKL